MIVVLWVQWHQEAVLGSVSKDPRTQERVPECAIQRFTTRKSHSSYKSIFIKVSQMLVFKKYKRCTDFLCMHRQCLVRTNLGRHSGDRKENVSEKT